MKFIKSVIFVGVVVGFFGAVAAGFFLIVSGGNPVDFVRTTLLRIELSSRQDELQRSAGTDSTNRIITVAIGDSPAVIANTLYDASLITDAQLFVSYVRVEGLDVELEAGTYFLNQTQTIPEMAQILTDSRSSSITFRVPEGSRIEEVAALIEEDPRFSFTGQDFLTAAGIGAALDPALSQKLGIPVGAGLEGFLFPDTYILPPDISAEGLRDILLQRFLDVTGEQLIIDAAERGFTMRETVTIASIVERESVWADENPLIASVYWNRIGIGMKLDADPTVQYALNGIRGRWWPNITQADYRGVTSPYNTYLNQGLPPGPIANPGLSAIRAAVYPAESGYLFFRARCDGSHYHNFAATYEEHLANGC